MNSETFSKKVTPPQRQPNIVRRSAFLDRIHANINKKVLTFSAPAGSGKTTLILDFIADLDIPCCWYSVDSGDQEISNLLEGLIAAVRRQFSAAGELTQSELASYLDPDKQMISLMDSLISEMNRLISEFYLFVIEDLHIVEENIPAKALINRLVERSPGNCHFLITSRNPVTLPAISKLTMQDEVMDFPASLFALSVREIRELLFERFGIPLGDDAASTVVEETQGWIPAVLLYGFEFKTRTKNPAGKLNKDDLFEYLAFEVFQQQPPDIQRFLLNTAILEDMAPDFCDSLLEIQTAGAMLGDLCKRNLFTSQLEGQRPVYRYHPLLREFLRQRLRLSSPEQFSKLHYHAGLLLEKEQQWDQAVFHFLQSHSYDDVVRVINFTGEEYIRTGKWSTVAKWTDALPLTYFKDMPQLVVLKAAAAIHLGDALEAARMLSEVLDKTSQVDRTLAAKALSWRSAAFRIMGRLAESKRDIKKAVDILTSSQGPASLTGDAYRRLGDICLEQGQLKGALRHQKVALKYYDQTFDLALISQVHNSLGVIYRRLGHIDKGSFHFEQAREGWQKLKNYNALAGTLNNIGIIYQRKGQYDLAMECLNLGLEKTRETGYKMLETCIRISIGELLRDKGEYPEALTHFQAGLKSAREIIEPYLVSHATIGMGEIYRLLGDPDKAEVFLKEALMDSEARKRSYEPALIGLQLALVESETGQFNQAIERLNKCCADLEEAGDLEALARGYFHLAHISFFKGQNDGIKQYIEKLEGLVQKLGYDNFLVVEGRDAVLLLQHCVTNQLGVQLFSRILGKIQMLPRSTRRPKNRPAFFFTQAEDKPAIKISVLREIKVEVSGRPVNENEWRSKRARELFLYLLITGKSQTREQICASIWPDLNISRGTSNFHINLYRARKAIFADVFTYLDGKYAINPDINIKFDVREFDELVQKAFQMPDSSSKLACLGKALEVYQGSLAPEIYSEWIEPHRRRLEDIYVKTLFLCSEGYAEIRDYEKAMQSVEKIISCDPYNDIAYTKLMEYQINSGDKTSALMTYRKYLDNVTRDLNSTSPKIQSLYRSLVNQ